MADKKVLKITEDVSWIGILDHDIVTFDIVMSTENGTSYNSFYIDADKKTVIETVKAGFSDIFIKYSYGSPGSLSWKLSMKYPIIMLNKSKLFFLILPLYYILTFPFCILLNFIDVHNFHESGTGLIVKAIK